LSQKNLAKIVNSIETRGIDFDEHNAMKLLVSKNFLSCQLKKGEEWKHEELPVITFNDVGREAAMQKKIRAPDGNHWYNAAVRVIERADKAIAAAEKIAEGVNLEVKGEAKQKAAKEKKEKAEAEAAVLTAKKEQRSFFCLRCTMQVSVKRVEEEKVLNNKHR
jgi:hypothetical protein